MLERGRTRRRGRIGDEAEQRHVVAMAEGKRRLGLVARGAPLSGDVWQREGRRSDRWELGIGRWVQLGLGGVLVGCGNGSVWLVRPKRPSWALSLSIIFFSIKELERRKERES